MSKLKPNKAAGTDEIHAELLIAAHTVSTKLLHPHTLREPGMRNAEAFDDQTKHRIIVKIPKKGDLKSCFNWRGITSLNVDKNRCEYSNASHPREVTSAQGGGIWWTLPDDICLLGNNAEDMQTAFKRSALGTV